MFYGASPRISAAEDHALVGCTRCCWMSSELPAARVQIQQAVCGACGQDVDRYIVYATHERRSARWWFRRRMKK